MLEAPSADDVRAGEKMRSARARLRTREDSPAALDAFLAAADTNSALRIWLGAEMFEELAHDPEKLRDLIDRDIANIDALLSRQLSAIVHAERFRSLEAGWRGVRFLADALDKGDRVKLRILNATWSELARDFERAPDFDQSVVFDLVYSQEFGLAGGEPFGLLIGDYLVSHRRGGDYSTDDVAALKSMATTAAAAFSPFVCGCHPSMLGLEDFESLSADIDLEEIFRQEEYVRWRALREMEDVRFLGICMPRVLMRDPWRDSAGSHTPFRFTEVLTNAPDGGYLWGNGAFAFAAVAIRAFIQTGWFAEIRGVRRGESGGGLVDNLPVSTFATDTPDIAFRHPVESAISDRQERRLSELGFIPISVTEYVPAAILYSNQSLQRPQRHTDAAATANARLSSMLQYILCVARFAHAIKVIGRERIATFTSASQCQTLFQSWLTGYVMANPNASLELRTRFPLREGRVTVTENPARPGILKLDMYLRPQLQLDEVSTGVRLTSELATPRPM